MYTNATIARNRKSFLVCTSDLITHQRDSVLFHYQMWTILPIIYCHEYTFSILCQKCIPLSGQQLPTQILQHPYRVNIMIANDHSHQMSKCCARSYQYVYSALWCPPGIASRCWKDGCYIYFNWQQHFSPRASVPSLHYFHLPMCKASACLKTELSFPWPWVLVFAFSISAPPPPLPPPPTAHKITEKCFEHNAYLCVHRQAQAVNKLNLQIIWSPPHQSATRFISPKTQLFQIIITQSALCKFPCWLTACVSVAVHL